VRYYPYGQERWNNGASVTDFGFTSQRSEKSFGLMDYNARYYSPVLGRFISPDSLVPDPTSSSGFNRYRYARNNPLLYVDPSGHCVVICAVAVLVGLALVVSTDQAINDDIVAAEAAQGSTAYRDTYPSDEQGMIGLTLMTLGFLGTAMGQGGLVEEPSERMDPNDIKYSQKYYSKTGSIRNENGEKIGDYSVEQNIQDLKDDPDMDLPPIRIFRKEELMNKWGPMTDPDTGYSGDPKNLKNGEIYTLDHRRLVAYREAGRDSIPVQWATDDEIRENRFEFSTPNFGEEIFPQEK